MASAMIHIYAITKKMQDQLTSIYEDKTIVSCKDAATISTVE